MEFKIYKAHRGFALKAPNGNIVGRFATKREAETARIAARNATRFDNAIEEALESWATSFSAQQQH